MNLTEKRSYQSAIRSNVDIERWASPYAVTLTLRQSIQPEPGYHVRISQEAASSNYRHFMNVLNRKILGKAHTKYGNRLKAFSIFEGGNDKRLHIHAVIECPRPELRATFPTLIRDTWLATDWGYGQVDIQADSDNGWINYISKLDDKPNYDTSIDWTNCSL